VIALYLIAAHMVGDFLLQNRWQAAYKLGDRWYRLEHVIGYCLPFIPIVALYARGWWQAGAFMAALAVLHFLTDSRRYLSTLGDVAEWTIERRRDPDGTTEVWVDYLYGPDADTSAFTTEQRLEKARNLNVRVLRLPPPNPWGSAPLMIDQTLHVCQLALLGGLFLR
jgi:Protein of unknown function (DUF3307)